MKKNKARNRRRFKGLFSVERNNNGDYDIIDKDGGIVLTCDKYRIAASLANSLATIEYYGSMPPGGLVSQEAR